MTERLPAKVAEAVELLRQLGWTCRPPPDPKAPCSYCGRPWDYNGSCYFGGCPLGADR